jgi:starch synthase
MQSGTVPVVRAVGVWSAPCSTATIPRVPPGEDNGYVFHQPDNLAIESALSRALGMRFGYRPNTASSWPTPCGPATRGPRGQDYLNIHEYIRHK